MGNSSRLKPAKPEPKDEQAAYMPRFPWRATLIGAVVLAAVVAAYWIKEQNKADSLRAQILRVHEQELSAASQRYREFRTRLETLIEKAGKRQPEAWAHPNLKISGLRSGQGLYLRIPKEAAQSEESMAKAAKRMTPDVIPSCLGLSPASARGLFQDGEFLMPAWTEEARETDSVARLEVIDDELARRIRRDLPAVMNMLRADWFMLVLEHGDNRRDAPVDVFLWDLTGQQAQPLLRTHVQAKGMLLPFKYVAKDAPPSPPARRAKMRSGGANDCSIAAQVKAITGEPVTEFGSDMPARGRAAADAGAPAAHPDASREPAEK